MNDPIKEGKSSSQIQFDHFKINLPKSLMVAIIIVICLQLLAGIINIPAHFYPATYHFTLPLSFIVGGTMALFLLFIYVKTNWNSIQDHLVKPASIGVFALSILLFFFLLPFAEFMTTSVPTKGVDWLEEFYKMMTETFEYMMNYKIAGFITVCLLAPFFEEILFRGILLRGLLQNGTNPILAIALSSILFGIAHMNPWQFFGAGILGSIFGYVYYRTKALWICIFLHALNNSLSYFMMLKYESMDENLTNPNDFTSVVICFVIAMLIGWGIVKLTENKNQWT